MINKKEYYEGYIVGNLPKNLPFLTMTDAPPNKVFNTDISHLILNYPVYKVNDYEGMKKVKITIKIEELENNDA